jgi:hypothetical protein
MGMLIFIIVGIAIAILIGTEAVRHRFYSPHGVTHNSVSVTTVQSITYSKAYTRLAAQGDADLSDSFQAKVNLQVSGTLVIQDAVQGDALLDAANGSLIWIGTPQTGGVAKTTTIEGVEFFSLNETDAHNALDGVTLNWNAFKPDGTDPVTVALAS